MASPTSSATIAASTSSEAIAASTSIASADPSEFTLISSDNRRFIIPLTAADLSPIIKRKLRNKSWPDNDVVLEKYDGDALAPVAEYLRRHGLAGDDEEMKERLDREFLADENLSGDPDAVFDTSMQLEIPGLMYLVFEKMSDRDCNYNPRVLEWVNRAFADDFSSDDEEKIEGGGEPEEAVSIAEKAVLQWQSAPPYSSSSSDSDGWPHFKNLSIDEFGGKFLG